MNYRVLILPSAQKDHNAIPSPAYEAIEKSMLELSNNARPLGCKKLQDVERTWRVRVGVYRIIYEIDDRSSTVTILKIQHRKDVYR